LKNYHIAVVGATGAVGTELFRVLERRSFPVANVKPISSARSVGKNITFRDESFPVEQLANDSFAGIDIAFFTAGSEISREFVPAANAAGALVIDNSPAFRMRPDVPLVIPEINGEDVQKHRGIIANPNCTAAVGLMALYPLHRAFGLRRVIGASYQAVSGTGARAIAELKDQVEASVHNREAAPQVYPHPIAFNLLPHIGSCLPTG
jgi:aspartate-semialdehyde dehydrogenase